MRILLDECVPARLRLAFPGHSVQTVSQAGWRGGEDAPLLAFAENRFDVFVTVDRALGSQSSSMARRLGIVIVRVPSNRIEAFEPLFAEILEAAERAKAGRIEWVVSPALR